MISCVEAVSVCFLNVGGLGRGFVSVVTDGVFWLRSQPV